MAYYATMPLPTSAGRHILFSWRMRNMIWWHQPNTITTTTILLLLLILELGTTTFYICRRHFISTKIMTLISFLTKIFKGHFDLVVLYDTYDQLFQI